MGWGGGSDTPSCTPAFPRPKSDAPATFFPTMPRPYNLCLKKPHRDDRNGTKNRDCHLGRINHRFMNPPAEMGIHDMVCSGVWSIKLIQPRCGRPYLTTGGGGGRGRQKCSIKLIGGRAQKKLLLAGSWLPGGQEKKTCPRLGIHGGGRFEGRDILIRKIAGTATEPGTGCVVGTGCAVGYVGK